MRNAWALVVAGIVVCGCDGRSAPATGSTSGAGGAGGTTTSTTASSTTTSSTTTSGATTSSTSSGSTPGCTSMMYWTGGDSGSQDMHPGRACLSCHVAGGSAPDNTFDVAGTVYPTPHEPDDCDGAGNVLVIITDGQNMDHVLETNEAGNFYHDDFLGTIAFPKPLRARVVNNGQTRNMLAAQMTGDCDSCHTESGAMNAPGRIMLP